jgi:hypothetical protein
MYAVTANIEPRMVTAAVVTIPANTSVMPNARTIGHAVGAGSSTVPNASPCLFGGSSELIFCSCTWGRGS